MERRFTSLTAGFLVASTLVYAQATTDQNGWKRVGDTAQQQSSNQNSDPGNYTVYPVAPDSQQQQPYPNGPQGQPYPNGGQQQQPYPNTQQGQQYPFGQGQQPYPNGPMQRPPANNGVPMAPVPANLNVLAGTFVTVRTNGAISSDHNHAGDAFSATLSQPMVVNGVVVAEPGQTVSGQVVEAQKAGRIEGTARLRVQLTELTLVDGQQLPIRTQLIGRKGPTSVGRDAGAVAGTTGLGAAIGAAAGWGTGAAIGAGAGAAVGVLGVLLTRGHASEIYPEETLTFRIEAPFNIDTERSAQAFRYVQPNEYNQPLMTQPAPGPNASTGPAPAPYGPYPYYASPYPYYGYGYGYPFYGPSFSFFVGRGFYGPGYYGRGYYGGGRGYYGGGRGFHR